jgi:hypothetical protein
MTVYTYHEPVPGMANPSRLLNLWQKTWNEMGYATQILSERDAYSHPGYAYYNERISRFPSVNPRGYDRACFIRHLAMANTEGKECRILLDYDVVNRDLTPSDASFLWHHQPCLTICEPTRVPCCVLGRPEDFEGLCDILCEYDPKGERHVSDMTIIRRTNLPCGNACVEHLNSGQPIVDHPGDGWKKAPMIHFSNYSFQKLGWTGDKAELIQRALATL